MSLLTRLKQPLEFHGRKENIHLVPYGVYIFSVEKRWLEGGSQFGADTRGLAHCRGPFRDYSFWPYVVAIEDLGITK